MSTAIESVYDAFYDALAADAPLTALVGSRIYDTVTPDVGVLSNAGAAVDPDADSAFPRITIDSPTEVDARVINASGNDNSYVIHLWSRVRGRRELAAMYARVEAVLNATRLSLMVGVRSHVSGRTSFVTAQMDSDGRTMHGVARYEAVTRQ